MKQLIPIYYLDDITVQIPALKVDDVIVPFELVFRGASGRMFSAGWAGGVATNLTKTPVDTDDYISVKLDKHNLGVGEITYQVIFSLDDVNWKNGVRHKGASGSTGIKLVNTTDEVNYDAEQPFVMEFNTAWNLCRFTYADFMASPTYTQIQDLLTLLQGQFDQNEDSFASVLTNVDGMNTSIENFRQQLDTILNEDANTSAIDKWIEVVNFLNGIQDSQTLDGIIMTLATKEYVNGEFEKKINKTSISTELEDDDTKVASAGMVKRIAATKQDAEEGKGLSTNDYDNAAKTKLDGLPSEVYSKIEMNDEFKKQVAKDDLFITFAGNTPDVAGAFPGQRAINTPEPGYPALDYIWTGTFWRQMPSDVFTAVDYNIGMHAMPDVSESWTMIATISCKENTGTSAFISGDYVNEPHATYNDFDIKWNYDTGGEEIRAYNIDGPVNSPSYPAGTPRTISMSYDATRKKHSAYVDGRQLWEVDREISTFNSWRLFEDCALPTRIHFFRWLNLYQNKDEHKKLYNGGNPADYQLDDGMYNSGVDQVFTPLDVRQTDRPLPEYGSIVTQDVEDELSVYKSINSTHILSINFNLAYNIGDYIRLRFRYKTDRNKLVFVGPVRYSDATFYNTETNGEFIWFEAVFKTTAINSWISIWDTFTYRENQIPVYIEMNSLSVTIVGCTHEYATDSLANNLWSNKAKTNDHIPLAENDGTILADCTTEKPYKIYNQGVGAPDIPPVAINQVYDDILNKKRYIVVQQELGLAWAHAATIVTS